MFNQGHRATLFFYQETSDLSLQLCSRKSSYCKRMLHIPFHFHCVTNRYVDQNMQTIGLRYHTKSFRSDGGECKCSVRHTSNTTNPLTFVNVATLECKVLLSSLRPFSSFIFYLFYPCLPVNLSVASCCSLSQLCDHSVSDYARNDSHAVKFGPRSAFWLLFLHFSSHRVCPHLNSCPQR